MLRLPTRQNTFIPSLRRVLPHSVAWASIGLLRPRFKSDGTTSNANSQHASKSGPGLKNQQSHKTNSYDAGHDHHFYDLHTTSLYSPGSPIFLPDGTIVFNRLANFLRRQYSYYGFHEVLTPTMYKKSLWEKSGHLENYAEDMFFVHTEAGGAENFEFGLKPMNCPGHCLIFASKPISFRNLPLRLADFSALHRNELSGVLGGLGGLTRLRRFHQDDGHIFCRFDQIEDEIKGSLDFVRVVYEALRLGPYRLVLSTRPERFIGNLHDWDQAEQALTAALNHSVGGSGWSVGQGDGAFYGPKIDIILTDNSGKEHQTATIQLDFQLPKRFGLKYITGEIEESSDQPGYATPIMIHRAVLGSVERLMALLVEHTQGLWPFWLNPRQAVILTVNNDPDVIDWAYKTKDILLGFDKVFSASQHETGRWDRPRSLPKALPLGDATGFTVDVDASANPISFKTKRAKTRRYGLCVVIGNKEVSKGVVSVDASGIPPFGGKNWKEAGRLEITPQNLLSFMKDRVENFE